MGKGSRTRGTIWFLEPAATGKTWRAQTEWPWFLLDISGFLDDATEAVRRTVNHAGACSPKPTTQTPDGLALPETVTSWFRSWVFRFGDLGSVDWVFAVGVHGVHAAGIRVRLPSSKVFGASS